MFLLPPANEVCKGNVFTGVCLSTRGGVISVHGAVSFQEGGSLSRRGVSVQKGGLSLEGSLSRGSVCPGISLVR